MNLIKCVVFYVSIHFVRPCYRFLNVFSCSQQGGVLVWALFAWLGMSLTVAHAGEQPITGQSTDSTYMPTQEVYRQVQETGLAHHTTWLRLLHYKQTQADRLANVSALDENSGSRVDKVGFFVNTEGKNNPQAEMMAMITALLSAEDSTKGNASVQCRFPARTHWLVQQFNLTLPAQANCREFLSWQDKLNPKQLALIFAQEYPDSMTSAFAHTLLRIDASATPQVDGYQSSYAINYTVAGSETDSMPVYAIKSMTGKYAGMMTIDPYLPKIDHYLQQEHRDIWSYPLKLTVVEVQQIIRHIWEVKDLSIPYYFLTDNCASEILRLIDVVRPSGQLYDEVSVAAIPSEVIRLLDEQQLLKPGEFIASVNSEKQADINKGRALLNPLLPLESIQSSDSDPTIGNNLQRMNITLGQQGNHHYAEVGVRASYHDLLDSGLGYRQNLHLEGVSAKVRAYEAEKEADRIQLQEAVLLKGRSYHPMNTARSGNTWGISAQLIQVNDASVNYENGVDKNELTQQHLVGHVGYEKGVSYAFGKPTSVTALPKHLCYGLGSGAAQVGKGITNGFRIGAGLNLGCVLNTNHNLRTITELTLPYWYHTQTALNNTKQGYWQPTASVGVQYDVAHNHALRIMANHELSKRVANNTDVQVGYYWYF